MIKKILRKIFRHDFYYKNSFEFYNYAYQGKIYTPYYNQGAVVGSEKPDVYNKSGQKMDVWFIRDEHLAHNPYFESANYFLWDRFDIGLDTHFYTHESMLQTMGNPSRQYGMFIESEFIVPKSYLIFKNNPGLHKNFDAVFTYSEDILNTVPNSRLFTSCATVWYGKEPGSQAVLTDRAFENKRKNISMVCSGKSLTKFHEIRHRFATAASQSKKVDIFGTFNGGPFLKYKSDSLQNYRFQIAVENGVSSYYFTEKILDCFASMTVPIYLGAPKIGDFFNKDGIIFITEKDVERLESVISMCDEKLYEAMLPAIKDNYFRSLKYMSLNDRLYEEHFRS